MSEILRLDFAKLGRVEGWKLNLGTPEDRRRALLRTAKKLREARAEELPRIKRKQGAAAAEGWKVTKQAKKRSRKAARLRTLSRKCWLLWRSLPEVDGGAPWGWVSVTHGRHKKR